MCSRAAPPASRCTGLPGYISSHGMDSADRLLRVCRRSAPPGGARRYLRSNPVGLFGRDRERETPPEFSPAWSDTAASLPDPRWDASNAAAVLPWESRDILESRVRFLPC